MSEEIDALRRQVDDLKARNDAHEDVHDHIRRIILVKIHELLTEVLRLESAINDPTRVFGSKQTGTPGSS